MSRLHKRSVVVDGHKTSVSLEGPFWDVILDVARTRHMTVSEVVSQVDRDRSYNNLSSALRLFALEVCRQRSVAASAEAAPEERFTC